MATDQAPEEEKTLAVAIEEQRRAYDHISNIYDQLRIKALALIAGEVAVITFIFSGDSARYAPIGVDRMIFFYTGIALLLASAVILLWIVSTVGWKLAHSSMSSLTLRNEYPTHLKFLRYLNDDYCKVNAHCQGIINKKCARFNVVVYLMPIGVIMLLVITKFGGRL